MTSHRGYVGRCRINLLALLLLAGGFQMAAEDGLIRNGSFAEAAGSGSVAWPVGWTVKDDEHSGTALTWGRDQERFVSAPASFAVRSLASWEKFGIRQRLQRFPEAEIEIRAKALVSGINVGYSALVVETFDADGKRVRWDQVVDLSHDVSRDGDWHEVSARWTPPAGAVAADLLIWLNGQEDLAVDDLQVIDDLPPEPGQAVRNGTMMAAESSAAADAATAALPAGWQVIAGSARREMVAGNAALALDSTTSAAARTTLVAPLERGRAIAGRIRGSGSLSRVDLIAGTGSTADVVLGSWAGGSLSTDWSPFCGIVPVAIPAGTALEVRATGAGIVWLDDLRSEAPPSEALGFDGTFTRWIDPSQPGGWRSSGDPTVRWRSESQRVGTRPAALAVTANGPAPGVLSQVISGPCPVDPVVLGKFRAVAGVVVPTVAVRLTRSDGTSIRQVVDLTGIGPEAWQIRTVAIPGFAGGMGVTVTLEIQGPGEVLIDDLQVVAGLRVVAGPLPWDAPPPLPTGPLLADGSCNRPTGTGGWKLVEAKVGTIVLQRDSTVFSSAPASVRIDLAGSAEGTVEVPLPNLPAGIYRLTGAWTSRGGLRPASLAGSWQDPDGNWPWKVLATFASTDDDHLEWKRFTADLVLDKPANTLRLVLQGGGTGSLWLDDVALEPISGP